MKSHPRLCEMIVSEATAMAPPWACKKDILNTYLYIHPMLQEIVMSVAIVSIMALCFEQKQEENKNFPMV